MKKPLLIIFGLRGTLLERLSIQDTASIIKRRPTLTFSKYNVWLRPGILNTLERLSKVSNLAIWSATPHRNTVPLVSMAFPGIDFKFIWHREQTTTDNIKRLLPANEKDNKFSVIKELDKVYKLYPQYSPQNTLYVDDKVFKTRCHAGNVLLVPTYDVNCLIKEPSDAAGDTTAEAIADQLFSFIKKELLNADDVRNVLPTRLQ
mmetsp:Transcript_16007/g.24940  ORF Transcript_16007/g.24940 Transcript_16007/m.24940 type:complete len:204 (-) Transcript_16007:67-678(-)